MPPRVRIPGPLEPARFVERPNRFVVHARLTDDAAPAGDRGEGREVVAHLPDPGRLTELLVPGRRVWLRHAAAPHRTTSWTAVLVEAPTGGGLVSVDTTLPNRLVGEALRGGHLPELGSHDLDRAEVAVDGSRFDFLLRDRSGRPLYLEVKSVTLVRGEVGLFPDAVTARGARHVEELSEIVERDDADAAVLFVVQRSGARLVRPEAEVDPEFATALERAAAAGVRLLARRCRVSLEEVVLDDRVPVEPRAGRTPATRSSGVDQADESDR